MRRKFWVTQRDEESVFLAADGSAKLSGRNYKFQEPTMRRESIVRRENISGESQGDRRRVSTWRIIKMTEESTRFFGLTQKLGNNFTHRHHIESRSSIASAEKRTYPIRLGFFDVTMSTNADLEVAQEKRIYDYWDVDENINLSTLWTNFTRFTSLSETPLKRYNEPGDDITSRSLMAWRIDKNSESSLKKKETRINEKRNCLFRAKRSKIWTCMRETDVPN